ncbi:MAG TPA: tetratricopeptide repeat protein, partial [Longimicrobiales bacterium]|nr:tetratricopeptide repeat protein [Longimicrobiales bacterium]
MSISKLKDEARRHEQKEEWEKAINAYLQVLRIGDDAGDVELPLYNRIGDLCVRLGRSGDAVRYYEQAADRYAEVGLYNNAMALCNKALRYRPDHIELLRKLGQFSALQGFLTEARDYYVEYADQQIRTGHADAAVAALTDFANIVDDGDTRELLGRRLRSQGRDADATAELQRAYALYLQAGNAAAAQTVASEILAIDPGATLSDVADAGGDHDAGPGLAGAGELPRLDDFAIPTVTHEPAELEDAGETAGGIDHDAAPAFREPVIESDAPVETESDEVAESAEWQVETDADAGITQGQDEPDDFAAPAGDYPAEDDSGINYKTDSLDATPEPNAFGGFIGGIDADAEMFGVMRFGSDPEDSTEDVAGERETEAGEDAVADDGFGAGPEGTTLDFGTASAGLAGLDLGLDYGGPPDDASSADAAAWEPDDDTTAGGDDDSFDGSDYDLPLLDDDPPSFDLPLLGDSGPDEADDYGLPELDDAEHPSAPWGIGEVDDEAAFEHTPDAGTEGYDIAEDSGSGASWPGMPGEQPDEGRADDGAAGSPPENEFDAALFDAAAFDVPVIRSSPSDMEDDGAPADAFDPAADPMADWIAGPLPPDADMRSSFTQPVDADATDEGPDAPADEWSRGANADEAWSPDGEAGVTGEGWAPDGEAAVTDDEWSDDGEVEADADPEAASTSWINAAGTEPDSTGEDAAPGVPPDDAAARDQAGDPDQAGD